MQRSAVGERDVGIDFGAWAAKRFGEPGNLGRDDVADLMVAADLFVFPSLWEGFGGVVAEAMALSLPVVATAVPEVVEVIGDGQPSPGVLVPIGDSTALATAVIKLLGNPELRESMGSAGRQRFEKNFNLDTVAARTVDMYRAFAEQGPT